MQDRNIFLIESLHLEVDKKIFDNRRIIEENRAKEEKLNNRVYPLNFVENSEYFRDLIYFLENKIDGILLIEIFNIFARHDIINISSVGEDKHPNKSQIGGKDNKYRFARKDNLYNHIITTAKAVISDEKIQRHGDYFVNNLIFFVLFHDIGKIPTLEREFGFLNDWTGISHEKRSSLVAQYILKQEHYGNKYKELLNRFYDWHWEPSNRKESDDLYGYYLDMFDYNNRKENEILQIAKEIEYDS